MLTQEELPEVAEWLVAAVSLASSPRQSLVAGLAAELRGSLGEGEPRVLVDRALRLCCDDGYRCTPAAVVQLLAALLPGHPAATLIMERLRTPPPEAADAFDALVLYSKLPFLDRDPTRAALRTLLDRRPVQPLVVVNGDRRAGKSYVAEFIDHVLHDRADTWHCRIAIEPEQGASVGPVELASDMVTLMGGDPGNPPVANTNLDRWAQEVANWVIGVANRSGAKWWFVLDGFTAGELRTGTQLLITKLARSLTTGVLVERHRLILIDFDRSVLPLQPGLINDQLTGPIPHSVVRAAVTRVIAGSGRAFDVGEVTAKVVEGLLDPVTDLPELGLRLGDLIAGVEAVA